MQKDMLGNAADENEFKLCASLLLFNPNQVPELRDYMNYEKDFRGQCFKICETAKMRNFARSTCFFLCFLTERVKSRWKRSSQCDDLSSLKNPTSVKTLVIETKELPKISWLKPNDANYFAPVLGKLEANGGSQQVRQRVNGANKAVKPE